MLKVMLVDDEYNVRQGVRMMIPWDELDLEVVAEASDGDEGLEKMLREKPDIVVADVKMPGKTGIEMTEEAIGRGFSGKVIILSGYSDFTYAKEAIALGVENFILKPVDEDELIDELKKARDKILKERQSDFRQEKGCEYINELNTKAVLSGDSEAVREIAFRNGATSYNTAIVCCTGADIPEKQSAIISNVSKFFNNCGNVDIVPMDLSGMQAVLFRGWKHSNIMEILYRLNKTFMGSIFIAMSNTVTNPDDITKAYNTVYEIYKNRFLYIQYGVVTEDILSKTYNGKDEIPDIITKAYAYMEINDITKLEKILSTLEELMRCRKYLQEQAKIACITMIMEIRNRVARKNTEKNPTDIISEEVIENVGKCSSLHDVIRILTETFTEVSNVYFGKSTKSNIERVVQYIDANYMHELKLEMLSGIFGYNSAYLGKVFHQYTGENFNNYVDKIRITEAKRLLSMEGYKVYEVAEMVGYTNINYFHNKFKKYVGISPLAYKKSFKMNDGASAEDEEEEE